jgi:hypothetical protein
MDNRQLKRSRVASGGKVQSTDAISGAGKNVGKPPMKPRTSGPGSQNFANNQARDKARRAKQRSANLASAKKRPAVVAANKPDKSGAAPW